MKKGFTLIELLAVIVILAVIALISTPIIIGLIDDARKEAFKSSAYGIIKAGELMYSKDLLDRNPEEVTFTYTNGMESSSIEGKRLDYNGSKPQKGQVKINKEGQVAVAIHNGTYCAEKGYNDSEVTLSDKTKEECTISSEITFACGQDLVDSRDSKVYKTVKIGEQCWMAENLKYTGNSCLNNTWKSNYEEDTNYGEPPYDACRTHQSGEGGLQGEYNSWTEVQVLYQWGAAMDGATNESVQGLCPNGWHIPTDAEWTILTNFLGENAGTKLKSLTYWDGTDNYGFNGLPAGIRINTGSLNYVGSYGDWWTSSISGSSAWIYKLYPGSSVVSSFEDSQAYGRLVRCLSD